MHFQQITGSALQCQYGRSDAFSRNRSLRLVTEVVNRSEKLSQMLATKGHTFQFLDEGTGTHMNTEDSMTQDFQELELTTENTLKTIDARIVPNHPELQDLVHECERLREPIDGRIFDWLSKVYYESRGFELGTFGSALLAITLKQQSAKWGDLALGYISDVVTLTHNFVTDLLDLVCPSTRVRHCLGSTLADQLTDKYRRAFKHVEFLLEIELNGTPATLNHYFNDNLEKWYVAQEEFGSVTNFFNSRQERVRNRAAAKAFSDCSHGDVVRLDDLAVHHPMSNAEHTIQDVHDILKSYYKVARKRFADSLRMQAADHFLITGPDTPLTLFSPAFVAALTPNQLEEVAGEDVSSKRKRNQLEKEMGDLEQGRRILN